MNKIFKTTILSICLVLVASDMAIAAPNVAFSNLYGGNGGTPFVDMASPGGRVSMVVIRSGAYIDSIGFTYRHGNNVTQRSFGGNGGNRSIFKLTSGEVITEFGGKSGRFVDSIYIRTSKGRFRKWGGGGGSRSFKFKGTTNNPIVGIWGRSGAYIDAIGVVRNSTTNSSGVSTGNLENYEPPDNSSSQADENCSGKCDSVTSRNFPAPPSSSHDRQFWGLQNQRLYYIVQKLAGNQSVFNRYLGRERTVCAHDLFCQIDTRSDAIVHVLGAQ
ncbi:MAG: hypothetical protein GY806_07580 [Gammaproteobacteria bacterium]|nr:hypothetical protein [Gammaproteobacteria bacterium]